MLSHVDMAMMYHLIKRQSVIKLYIFYNMLEVVWSNHVYNSNSNFSTKIFTTSIYRLVTDSFQCLVKILLMLSSGLQLNLKEEKGNIWELYLTFSLPLFMFVSKRKDQLWMTMYWFSPFLSTTVLHTVLVLLQATTLNVAINSSNKALLTIMMSNNVSLFIFSLIQWLMIQILTFLYFSLLS